MIGDDWFLHAECLEDAVLIVRVATNNESRSMRLGIEDEDILKGEKRYSMSATMFEA